MVITLQDTNWPITYEYIPKKERLLVLSVSLCFLLKPLSPITEGDKSNQTVSGLKPKKILKLKFLFDILVRSYQCSQCLKLFSIERLLSDHMRSHINQYKCTMCDMTSTKPSMLAKHYRYRHMNERPFQCQICKKT